MYRNMVLAVIISTLLFSGCAMTAHERDGMKYLHAQAGLGIDEPSVPNLVEFELPLAYAKVTSPLATEIAKVMLGVTGNTVDFVLGGLGKFIGIGD